MRNSRSVLRACAVLACAGLGRIALGEPSKVPAEPLSLTPLYADAASTAPATTVPALAAPALPAPAEAPAEASSEERPLMGLLLKTPIVAAPTNVTIGQLFQNARINIYGWVEGSYEYNFLVRDRTPNAGRAFDFFENNRGYLNQLDLTFERTVDLTSKQLDFGGRMDLVYGSDARFTVSSGLLDKQANFAQEAFFDIHQLYVDIAVPVLNGVRVRIGKFEFIKVLDPNQNYFYTHPFEYSNGFPYTLTGISVETPITDKMTIEAGISRGWDQSLRDNNSVINAFGHFKWDINDATTFSFAALTGPEQPHDNVHFTTAIDASLQYIVSDELKLSGGVIYGHQSAASFGTFPGSNTPGLGSTGAANWYGINTAAVYRLNGMVAINGRLEWYRDEEGYTFGNGEVVNGMLTSKGTNLYEITLGLTLTPFHNTALGDYVVLRPEIRYDYSSTDFFHLSNFGTGTRHDQCTVAVDAIFNF